MAEWLRRLRSALMIVVFITVFMYIFSLNFRPPTRMDVFQRTVVETISPVIQAASKVTGLFEGTLKDYLCLREVKRENETLRTHMAALEQKVSDYHEAYVENMRLRRLLDFRTNLQADSIAAQVVLHDTTGWFQTAMIDRGFRDKVAQDMAVVNDEGVVGRTLDISDHYARVLLITDPASSVDAIIQRNRVRGILGGKDANGCMLKYVRGNVDVQVGDLIITSGKDGIFPKGLRLGIIQGVFKDPVDLFQKIEVKPAVRFGALEEVLVIRRDLSPPDSDSPAPVAIK
jgi:rod shape-determining protein MreC